MKNVLINRSDAIGDTLLSIPMAHLIKKEHPDWKVIFLINKRCADLFKNNPHVDEVWCLDYKQSKLNQYKDLNKKWKMQKIHLYFHVGGSFLPTWMAFIKGVSERGGLVNRFSLQFLLNKGERQRRSMVEMHEAEYNLNLLRPFGLHYHYKSKKELMPCLHLESEKKEKILSSLGLKEELSVDGENYIVLHAGMRGHTLNWSPRNFVRLLPHFEKEFPGKFHFIFSYTTIDQKYFKVVEEEFTSNSDYDGLRERVTFWNGEKFGLEGAIKLISKASLYIGASTGTTHIANALKTPMVGIYPPIKVQSALRWGPYNRDDAITRVVVPDVVCGEIFKCAGKSCPYYECMPKIEVKRVFKDAFELLQEAGAREASLS